MKKAQGSLLIVIVGIVIAFTLSHCSGCALVQPEGQMTMEVSDESAE